MTAVRAGALALSAWVALAPVARADSGPPAWLQDAAARPAGSYDDDVPSLVLLCEQTVEFGADGRVTTTERGAIRVLTAEGRDDAACAALYRTDGGKVADLRAWLLPPSGSPVAFGKKDWVDARLDRDDVYDEARTRGISAADRAVPGAVFGYEWTTEMREPFMQFDLAFQDRRPVLLARLTVRAPAGWNVSGTWFNHEPVAPESGANGTMWVMRDLPPVAREPSAPPLSAQVPRIAVSVVPAAPEASRSASFSDWSDVSRWLALLSDGAGAPDDALRARAGVIAANAASDLERIRAIGEFVQRVHYVSIQTGVGRGGGYRPHSAPLVLDKGYGDCKDKANLMRALLAALEIPAWLVGIHAGDPGYVRDGWPSPQQFNHCIVAVRAPAADSLPTQFEHPELGRLVAFDPTDPWTPLGGLPESEQGSLALLIRAGETALTRMPLTAPAANAMRRRVDARLEPDGTLSGTIHETSVGTAGRQERAWRQGVDEAAYRRDIERWVGHGMPGAVLEKFTTADDPGSGRFELDLRVRAPRYAKRLSPGLRAVCPALVSRHERFAFTDPDRTQPIAFEPESVEETATIALPDGFEVEELPKPVDLDTDFARYRTSYAAADGAIHFERSLETRRVTLDPERYAEVQAFFRSVRRGETALVLLRGGD